MENIKAALSRNEQDAVTEFKANLINKVGNYLIEIKLFGSKATGDSTTYSDLYLLVILSEVTTDLKDFIYDVAVDMNLKYDVVISPVIYSKHLYQSDYLKDTCFYKAAVQNGIKI